MRALSFRCACASPSQAVKDAVAEVRQPGTPPRVALIEWIDPIMGSGHWWGGPYASYSARGMMQP